MSGRPVRIETAERFAREALADSRTVSSVRYFAQAAEGRLAVMRGDALATEACFQDLRENTPAGVPHRMDPIVGLLARAVGKMDEAVSLIRASLELAERTEHEFRRLWNAYYLAETLAERSRSGDLEEAERLLGELLETTERTGSVLLERKCRALLERLSASPRSDGLTERQIEVLRQIAAGKANKEIAYSLGISTSTVNMHVRRILERIGAANRAEAASYATRNGLADGGT